MPNDPTVPQTTLVDRLNDGALDYDYSRRPRVYARFPRSYYGNPFLMQLEGQWLLCIEEEAGIGSWRGVSDEFARAWIKEFGNAD